MSDEMSGLPIVPLKGSEGWREAYEIGDDLEAAFPAQDGHDFAYGCHYNYVLPEHDIARLVMLEQGMNDGGDWVWFVVLVDGTRWLAIGGCDYTGWDCQSYMSLIRVEGYFP